MAKKIVDEYRTWLNDDPDQNSEVMWEVLANDYIAPLLHQSRTELMRKVVGVVPGLCSVREHGDAGLHDEGIASGEYPCEECNDHRSALTKLAEDEKINLE